MAIVTDLPSKAVANAFMPKERLYQAGDVNHTIRQLFIEEVEKITLHAVIAPKTMNITNEVYDELYIFDIKLKDQDISLKVLESIDKNIPRPILFAITRPDDQRKYAISYKQLKANDTGKSKIVHYYNTAWDVNPLRVMGNSVKSIYVNFIRQIEPTFDPSKPIIEAVHDIKHRQQVQKQIEAINKKISNEPSVAKRQELARQRHQLEQGI